MLGDFRDAAERGFGFTLENWEAVPPISGWSIWALSAVKKTKEIFCLKRRDIQLLFGVN